MSDTSWHQFPTIPEISAELRQWRAAHPNATFTEIEQAVEAQVREVRAGLLTDLIPTDEPDAPCPDCGARLVGRGVHTRTLVTQGNAPVSLSRSYATCPACGRGLFPPG